MTYFSTFPVGSKSFQRPKKFSHDSFFGRKQSFEIFSYSLVAILENHCRTSVILSYVFDVFFCVGEAHPCLRCRLCPNRTSIFCFLHR